MAVIPSELKAAIRKNVQTYFVINFSAGVFFALIGAVMLAAAKSNGALALAGTVILLIGAANAYVYWQRRIDIPDLLEQTPQRVVWVYKKVSSGSAYGVTVARFSFVIFALDNKRRVQVRLPARDADRLLDILQAELTHATFGYSRELERQYKSDPKSLRKND
jgi:hypothetical protein